MSKLSPAILIAEDNKVNATILEKMLDAIGYSCEIVSNGLEAVNATLDKDYDIILMDIQMPIKDGLTATREILAGCEEQRPLIVAVTASNLIHDEVDYYAAGMFAILSKPFRIKDLKKIIDQCESYLRDHQSTYSKQA